MALTDPLQMSVGDTFEVYPDSANWNIHDNTITGCTRPVALGAYGGATSVFRDNIITRGGAEGVTSAVSVSGQYKLIGNHISGFGERGAAALELKTNRPAGTGPMVFSGNVIESCSQAVKTTDPRLWEDAEKNGNLFIGCRAAEE